MTLLLAIQLLLIIKMAMGWDPQYEINVFFLLIT
jgi:hypothetical protein